MSEGHFDAVIVGSGFGGSVMGYRLAEAGMSVCILERGKAYPPGSFARSPWQIGRNFWDPSEGMHGIFDVWSFRGLGGIVASGLGGGSLVYSNVVLRKDESTFVQEDLEHGGYEYWPVTYADLEPYYERHEQMLGVSPYPFDQPPYDQTYKTRAMQYASEQLGLQWFLPPLALAYARPGEAPGEPVRDDPPNLHGRTRLTCRLCGECNVGCNYGSKNTLDFNYLSRASLDYGALIRSRCEVKSFAPRHPRGYSIDFVDHSDAVEGEKRERSQELHTITADRLILSAGVFGTTYLLLKNRQAFPVLIIEGAWQLGFVRRAIRFAWSLVRLWLRRGRRSEIGREVSALFGPARLSSSSLPLFSMGRDIPDGTMKLTKDGYLDVDWTTRKSGAFFDGVRKTGKDVSRVLNANFVDNLPWYLARSVTVHPLGGCPMGRNEREGVVDSYGRVFNYPGLVIADGSTMPGPVGPNPSNTIAALAHRAAEQIIAESR